MEEQIKYFITVGNYPQFVNKKIEPQGDSVRYSTRHYVCVVNIHCAGISVGNGTNCLFQK